MSEPGAYAGDLTPRQAWDLLLADPAAVMIDVRTRAEWTFVGLPDLSSLGRDLGLIEWNRTAGGDRNPLFLTEVAASGASPDAPVLFLCRSGVRSRGAAIAATAAGFRAAYNVAEGFEGDLDEAGHRGVGGWKTAGLPWRQT